MATLAAANLHFLESPVIRPLARMAANRRWGLLKWLRPPRWIEIAAAVLLMDYTLYWWHIAVHLSPFLWRFHAVHHVDLDLDASTALRFHFGELALSVPYRAAQILLIGADPQALTLWQTFLSISILFHHSNVRLPEKLEKILSRIIVTPRMHGIHHATERELRDTNWSSGLSFWDLVHRTFRLDRPQDQIVIGVLPFTRPEQVTLPKILAMPFQDRPSLEFPFQTGERR